MGAGAAAAVAGMRLVRRGAARAWLRFTPPTCVVRASLAPKPLCKSSQAFRAARGTFCMISQASESCHTRLLHLIDVRQVQREQAPGNGSCGLRRRLGGGGGAAGPSATRPRRHGASRWISSGWCCLRCVGVERLGRLRGARPAARSRHLLAPGRPWRQEKSCTREFGSLLVLRRGGLPAWGQWWQCRQRASPARSDAWAMSSGDVEVLAIGFVTLRAWYWPQPATDGYQQRVGAHRRTARRAHLGFLLVAIVFELPVHFVMSIPVPGHGAASARGTPKDLALTVGPQAGTGQAGGRAAGGMEKTGKAAQVLGWAGGIQHPLHRTDKGVRLPASSRMEGTQRRRRRVRAAGGRRRLAAVALGLDLPSATPLQSADLAPARPQLAGSPSKPAQAHHECPRSRCSALRAQSCDRRGLHCQPACSGALPARPPLAALGPAPCGLLFRLDASTALHGRPGALPAPPAAPGAPLALLRRPAQPLPLLARAGWHRAPPAPPLARRQASQAPYCRRRHYHCRRRLCRSARRVVTAAPGAAALLGAHVRLGG